METYSANHPEVHVIYSDIRNVTEKELMPFIPKDGIDLVSSGMPCETFSTAGNTSRSFYDDRQFLFREGIRIAKATNAKLILFENVPAITTKTVTKESHELIVDMIKDELRNAGYGNFIEVVLSATDFGVPQKRKRFFILASRFADWHLSAPTPTCNNSVCVGDALAGLPNVIPNTAQEATKYCDEETEYSAFDEKRYFLEKTNLE